MYLLDTNVVSELRRNDKAERKVAAWARGCAAETFYLSIVTALELERGIQLIERRDDAQARVLRRWLDEQLLPQFSERILPIDLPVAQRCAALHVPNPRPERDALIAATALVHGLTMVTRNVTDFETTGVDVFNPWA